MSTKPLLRDQVRANNAYTAVRSIRDDRSPGKLRENYRTEVMSLGPTILRIGLAGALSLLEGRAKNPAVDRLLAHLAAAGVVGLTNASGGDLASKVRTLSAADYMLATRELLRVATWLRRAVQALVPAESGQEQRHA